MIDSVFQLLFRFDGAITEKQICQSLGITAFDATQRLHEQLTTDDRFVQMSEKLWNTAPLSDLIEDRPITKTAFIITDIETTGSIKGKDRIIDLAAQKVINGEVIEEFESLVNPQKNISGIIKRLTGISNQMVSDAPLIETVMPTFIDFVGDGVFVAHNALFDYYFILSEIRRLELPMFQNQVEVCSHRLAKKLLPSVKAHGVVGLAKYYDYQFTNHHRAMPDVEATKFYMDRFLEQLEELEIESLHQLIEFQVERISKKKLKKKISRQFRKKNR